MNSFGNCFVYFLLNLLFVKPYITNFEFEFNELKMHSVSLEKVCSFEMVDELY